MLRNLVILALIAAPSLVRAQGATFCAGALVAESFYTQVTPGPTLRATYSVVLRNTHSASRRVQVLVMGSLQGRPNGTPVTLNPNQRLTVPLGYQTILPGTQALRGEQLANVTRVSCV